MFVSDGGYVHMLHEVFRTDMSDNVSASLYRVHRGKVILICVLA